jgi:PAS domain S-box-containing protein
LAGALALAGWTLASERLKTVMPGLVAMNPLVAIGLIVLATALWLQRDRSASRRRQIAVGLATAVASVGGLKMISYALRFDLPVDRWLFANSLGDNRMAPNAALCLLMSGGALASIDHVRARRFWPAQGATFVVMTVSLVSLMGYSFGATSLYQMGSYVPIALNTAAAFGVLSVGILFARPDRGIWAVILNTGAGGVMARRLLPAVIVIPWVLGALRLIGQRSGYYDTEFGTALLITSTVMLFALSVGWIAAALNRTDAERQKATDDLQRSSAEISDLYNRAPCGYHSLDHNGNIAAINDTELAWLGYERDELIGKKHFAEFIASDGLNVFRDAYARLKQTGSVKDLEYELRRKDGSTFPVIVNSTAVYDGRGEFLSSRTTVFDATEKKRAEVAIGQLNEALEERVATRTAELAAANADLEQKNLENETFVYSASHDLRSPLVNLQAFSQELSLVLKSIRQLIAGSDWPAERTAQGLALIDVDMQRGIRFIQTAVTRLDAIIDALLRLSRAGRVEYQPQWIDTNQMVGRILESMSATLFDRGVAVEVADLPECWGDPTAVEQVFANLIGNSVNYLDAARPGTIAVGSSQADSNVDGAPSVTIYSVKDNGLGIDPAYHGKVFQALKRLHPKVATGEGIGLAIAKRIVDRHSGEIWFESAAGEGTTFFVKLPVSSLTLTRAPVTNTPNPKRKSHVDMRKSRNLVGGRR